MKTARPELGAPVFALRALHSHADKTVFRHARPLGRAGGGVFRFIAQHQRFRQPLAAVLP
jgi:hypothetical protein